VVASATARLKAPVISFEAYEQSLGGEKPRSSSTGPVTRIMVLALESRRSTMMPLVRRVKHGVEVRSG